LQDLVNLLGVALLTIYLLGVFWYFWVLQAGRYCLANGWQPETMK
jgi:hypothetical protein